MIIKGLGLILILFVFATVIGYWLSQLERKDDE
jgi:hypothetical protein